MFLPASFLSCKGKVFRSNEARGLVVVLVVRGAHGSHPSGRRVPALTLNANGITKNPIKCQRSCILTSVSEIPALPIQSRATSKHMRRYTALQIVINFMIFTLTKVALLFPLIVFTLVPARLLVKNMIGDRRMLEVVDA